MDDNNYNGASYKDLQLEAQINQALSGYNSIARKISDLKKDIIPKPKNKNKYLNYKYIQKSPLLPKKRREDIFVNRNNETFYGRNNLIEDFKDTLEKSQIIKDDLLRSTFRSSTRKKNKNSNINLSLNRTPITYKKNYLRPINKGYATSRINANDINNILSSLDDDDDDFEDSNSNGGLNYNIPNGQNINKSIYSNKYRKIKNNDLINKKEIYENDILDYDKNDKKKLELSRNTIINTYQKIKKENRILEVEINNYKKLSNKYLNFGGNFGLKDNNFSQKTFNSYKQSFQQTIQNNCRIIDLILNTQKQSKYLSDKIKGLIQKNKKIFQKIEQKNRKNAENQILNEENEQKIFNLEEEKNILTEELEKNKILLLNLKNKENNLNILNESNKRVLHDNEEHIIKLKNTINQFNKYKNLNLNNNNYNQIQFNNNMKLYEQKINNLKLEINNLMSNKQKALFYRDNLQSKIFDSPNYLNNNERQYSQQYNLIKKENDEKKQFLKEREKQIVILNKAVDSLSMAIKSNNPQEVIKKMNIRNLINNIELADKKYITEEEKIINNQIKQIEKQNEQKNNEMDNISQKYKNILFQKEQEINNLELILNQLNLNLAQNNINAGLFKQAAVNSINELTLDDENHGFIDNENGLGNIPLNMNNEDMEINLNDYNDINDLNNINMQQLGFNQEEEFYENMNDNENEIKELEDDDIDNDEFMQMNGGINIPGQVEDGEEEYLQNGENEINDVEGNMDFNNNNYNFNNNEENGDEQENEEQIDENEELENNMNNLNNNINEEEGQFNDINEIKEIEDEDINGEVMKNDIDQINKVNVDIQQQDNLNNVDHNNNNNEENNNIENNNKKQNINDIDNNFNNNIENNQIKENDNAIINKKNNTGEANENNNKKINENANNNDINNINEIKSNKQNEINNNQNQYDIKKIQNQFNDNNNEEEIEEGEDQIRHLDNNGEEGEEGEDDQIENLDNNEEVDQELLDNEEGFGGQYFNNNEEDEGNFENMNYEGEEGNNEEGENMNNGEEENDELEYNMDEHFDQIENEDNYDDNNLEGEEGYNENEDEQDNEQFNEDNIEEDNHEVGMS